MHKLLAITTDFGDSFAAAQLHAVLAQVGFEGKIIENHDVTPYSILEGAFQILTLCKFTPAGTIHLGIVDPGVGSSRKGIIIKTKKFYFVGPDNGLLYPASSIDTITAVYQLQESKICYDASNTFHGRDIFVKVAGYLGSGYRPEDIGAFEIDPEKLEKLTFQNGQIMHIDYYGNVKIHWSGNIIPGKQLHVTVNNQPVVVPIVKTFSDVAPQKPLALLGSSDTLELAVNLGNAAQLFEAKVGTIIDINAS